MILLVVLVLVLLIVMMLLPVRRLVVRRATCYTILIFRPSSAVASPATRPPTRLQYILVPSAFPMSMPLAMKAKNA
jgi:hypothetical protein